MLCGLGREIWIGEGDDEQVDINRQLEMSDPGL